MGTLYEDAKKFKSCRVINNGIGGEFDAACDHPNDPFYEQDTWLYLGEGVVHFMNNQLTGYDINDMSKRQHFYKVIPKTLVDYEAGT